MRYNKQCDGFSIIELVVVVAIIMVLASVALPIYQTHIGKAHLQEDFDYMYPVAKDAETYWNENGGSFVGYPEGNKDRADNAQYLHHPNGVAIQLVGTASAQVYAFVDNVGTVNPEQVISIVLSPDSTTGRLTMCCGLDSANYHPSLAAQFPSGCNSSCSWH